MMTSNEESKRVKRIASVLYILVMAVIVGGTYLNQLNIQSTDSESQGFQPVAETPIEFTGPN